jgi:hypothetical protein
MRIVRISGATLRPMSEFPRGADPSEVEVYEPSYSQRDGSRGGVALSVKKWPEHDPQAVGWRWKDRRPQDQMRYLGQCDVLRRQPGGERKWQEMIRDRVEIGRDELMRSCETSAILDDPDRPLGEQMDELVADDPSSYFARSHWGGRPCVYLMTKGFEFIFA